MRRFQSLIHRFGRDERGAFAMIFAIMAIVLVAMSGAVVDFTSMQQSRTKAQVALDAAALALQPTIYTDSASKLQTEAQALLVNRLADATTTWKDCGASGHDNPPPCVHVATPVLDTSAGSLTFSADITVPMNFVSLVGVNTLTAQIESVATRQKLNLEVALVLDNSGSMSTSFGGWRSTRLSVLKDSANCAANILYYGVTGCGSSVAGLTKNDSVSMALVPFNDEVNVGATYALAHSWLDRTGASGSYANDNFASDNSDTAATGVDRIALFNKMKDSSGNPLQWRGCVEARIEDGVSKNYDTDDTPPQPGFPETYFVPLFAPDEPDTVVYSRPKYSNSYIPDNPTGTNQCSGTKPTAERTLQERLCKYNGATPSSSVLGPNADCPVSAIQPLTTDPATITSAINSMVANGNTNIQEGTAWGFRVLSPGEPFTEGRPYDQATSKVMIIMTDGENTYSADSSMNGASLYTSYGYPWDNYKSGTTGYRGRMGNKGWGDSDFETEINRRLSITCTNAKAQGITIYTIGLATDQTSDPTGNTTLLTNCASKPEDAYFPQTSGDLQQAFVDIANQLAALRLAK
ncbi:MAG TPA: TadE/TadG family type IV pilus assembly protein [Devosia sp.]|nr:TadE/TadG family type IV pilus assembly protein [Devosia sp.]